MTTKTEKYVSENILMVDCYEWESGYLHFSRPIMNLSDNERGLNAGRFTLYNESVETNPMSFYANSMFIPFQNCVWWLYEECRDLWNFTVTLNRVDRTIEELMRQDPPSYRFDFFFTKPTDAVKFKLNLVHD